MEELLIEKWKERIPELDLQQRADGKWEWTFRDCDSDLRSYGHFHENLEDAILDFAASIAELYKDILADHLNNEDY